MKRGFATKRDKRLFSVVDNVRFLHFLETNEILEEPISVSVDKTEFVKKQRFTELIEKGTPRVQEELKSCSASASAADVPKTEEEEVASHEPADAKAAMYELKGELTHKQKKNLKRKKAYYKRREEANKEIVRAARRTEAQENLASASGSSEKTPTISTRSKKESLELPMSALDKLASHSTTNSPAAKRSCSVLLSNPGPSASQSGNKKVQANQELQALLLKVMQDQQVLMQSFAQQQQVQQQQQQQQAQLMQACFAELAQQQMQALQQLQPPQAPITPMQAGPTQEQMALWQAQQFQQQQLAQEQQQMQLLQQQQQALEQQQVAALIPQHAYTNLMMAMRAPLIMTPNGLTYVTPPTPTSTVHYVRAPMTRPSGPSNLYPPSDNDNEPMQ